MKEVQENASSCMQATSSETFELNEERSNRIPLNTVLRLDYNI